MAEQPTANMRNTAVPTPDSQAARIKALERELHEYIRVEAVLVECGVVSKDRLQQCHDMVHDLTELQR